MNIVGPKEILKQTVTDKELLKLLTIEYDEDALAVHWTNSGAAPVV